MPFELMSFLEGNAFGIFLAIILKIISKIKNRNRNRRSDAVSVAPLDESQYIPPHPNPPFDAHSQGITPKPIFETNGEGGTIKRFIRG